MRKRVALFGRYAYNLGTTIDGNEIQATARKFGMEGSSGIAWTAGDVKIIPYHSRVWQGIYSQPKLKTPPLRQKRDNGSI
ncbi:MAG: hypothetical protein IPG53_23555 [Ignavibacteriales bacterium]|nr:hypothetical protein [Ignavibacteriales bacterium]